VGFTLPLNKASLVVYKLQTKYNKWEFNYDPVEDQMMASGGSSLGSLAPGSTTTGTGTGTGVNGGLGGSNSINGAGTTGTTSQPSSGTGGTTQPPTTDPTAPTTPQ
jgi:hypothetical protein